MRGYDFSLIRSRRIAWWLLLPGDLYAAGLGVYLALRLLSGYRLWPVALSSQFLHLLLLPFIPLLLLMLLLRCWRRAVLAGVGVIAFIWLFGGLFLPKMPSDSGCANSTEGCHDLTVMTYNVGAGLAEPDALVDALRSLDADIVGLQEVSIRQRAILERELRGAYPYQAFHWSRGSGWGLLSRYPIVEEELVQPGLIYQDHRSLPYLLTTLEVEDVLVTVIVFRANSPRFGGYGGQLGYYPWPSDEVLVEAAVAGPTTIILGDLNTTDQSEVHVRLHEAGLTDAFRAAGQGFGLTFPSRPDGHHSLPNLRLLRIDYVWTTQDFHVVRAWVGPDAGSDHLPVLARLYLLKSEGVDSALALHMLEDVVINP